VELAAAFTDHPPKATTALLHGLVVEAIFRRHRAVAPDPQLGLASVVGTLSAGVLHVPPNPVRSIPRGGSPIHIDSGLRAPKCSDGRNRKRNVNVKVTLRAIVTALGALVLSLAGSGIAAAHTALASSDPAGEATATASPAAIVLTFTEDINPAFANVAVSSTDGRNWVIGNPRVDGPRLTAAVGPDRLTNGAYTVGYRVVSADGHPVTGSYNFTVAGPPVQTPATHTPAGAAPNAAEPPAASPGADTKPSILIAAAAGLALGGVITFWQSRRRRRRNTVDNDAPQ
jgi:methionine-rich copper-binding protein CopC